MKKQNTSGKNLFEGLIAAFFQIVEIGILYSFAIVLYLNDDLAGFVTSALLTSVAVIVYSVEKKLCREKLGCSRSEMQRIMFSLYRGSIARNGFRISFVLRVLPLVLTVLCLLISGVVFLLGNNHPDICRVSAILVPVFSFGLETCVFAAVANGTVILKLKDIQPDYPEKLGKAARVHKVLADKSVFAGKSGAETGGIYLMGHPCAVSSLTYEKILPVLAAVYTCDDTELENAFGFRRSLSDSLMRMLRTSLIDHRELIKMKTEYVKSYRPELGYAEAKIEIPGSDQFSVFRVGKPEPFMGSLISEYSEKGSTPVGTTDIKKIQAYIDQVNLSGSEIMAVVRCIGEEKHELIGLLNIVSPVSENVREAVSQLSESGVETVYVSSENVSCAFYRAHELGIVRDMSRVLTGARIDHFKTENLEKASNYARVCCEADDGQRVKFRKLASSGRITASVSNNPNDGIICDSGIAILPRPYPADFTSKNCGIEEVSLIIRTSKQACTVAARSYFTVMSAAISVALAVLLCVLNRGLGAIPFSIPAAILLTTVLPIPAVLSVCEMNLNPEKTPIFGFPYQEKQISSEHLKNGVWLPIVNILIWIFSSLFVLYMGVRGAKISETGNIGQFSSEFLALAFMILSIGMINRVWGKSLFSLREDENGLRLVLASLILLVLCGIISLVRPIASLFSMQVLLLRELPLSLAGGLVSLFLYEIIMDLVNLRKNGKKRKFGKRRP